MSHEQVIADDNKNMEEILQNLLQTKLSAEDLSKKDLEELKCTTISGKDGRGILTLLENEDPSAQDYFLYFFIKNRHLKFSCAIKTLKKVAKTVFRSTREVKKVRVYVGKEIRLGMERD